MTNDEELERLYSDRRDAESDLEHLYEELNIIERENPDDYEDMDEWNDLFHEINQLENDISYLSDCIEDLELGYED